MENKIEVNVTGGVGQTLTILEGNAQSPKPLNSKVHVDGSILAPAEYAKMNYEKFDNSEWPEGSTHPIRTGILTYSHQPGKQFITFNENPADPIEGAVITGKLVENPDLAPWQINTKRTFSPKGLVEHIIANAFAMGAEQAKTLIKLLRNHEVKFEAISKQEDDRAGKKENSFKEEIKFLSGQLPKDLSITLPLYKGTWPVEIPLEIEIDNKGNEVAYSFWSLTLENDMRVKAAEIITAEVEKFKPLFVCIEQI